MKCFGFILFLSTYITVSNAFQCIDDNNNAVDWYIVYKIPHIKKNAPNKLIQNGFAYMYLTSENTKQWTLSTKNVMDANDSIFAKTLSPVFNQINNSSVTYIFYNDERPSSNNKLNKGHTKGVIAADANQGFWLVHSVPLFPPNIEDGYSYPLSGTVYGQSALCVSLDADNINAAGLQLLYNQPQIYSNKISNVLTIKYPNLAMVINREQIPSAPWFNIRSINTLQGQEFVTFAKTRDFSKELYEDLVAPGLNSSLLVETWLNGQGRLDSNCSGFFSVKNIKDVNLTTVGVTFASTLDHSKWAVSVDLSNPWTCIGDINRQEHQKKRGGGTVCINSANIATLYKSSIETLENCPKTLQYLSNKV